MVLGMRRGLRKWLLQNPGGFFPSPTCSPRACEEGGSRAWDFLLVLLAVSQFPSKLNCVLGSPSTGAGLLAAGKLEPQVWGLGILEPEVW